MPSAAAEDPAPGAVRLKLAASDHGANSPTIKGARRLPPDPKGTWSKIKRIRSKVHREVLGPKNAGELRRVSGVTGDQARHHGAVVRGHGKGLQAPMHQPRRALQALRPAPQDGDEVARLHWRPAGQQFPRARQLVWMITWMAMVSSRPTGPASRRAWTLSLRNTLRLLLHDGEPQQQIKPVRESRC